MDRQLKEKTYLISSIINHDQGIGHTRLELQACNMVILWDVYLDQRGHHWQLNPIRQQLRALEVLLKAA